LLLLAEPEPDFLPPRLEDPSEFAIAAARLLLIPFLCSAISLLTSAGDRPSGTVSPVPVLAARNVLDTLGVPMNPRSRHGSRD
jgi:hypothetical protein